MKAGEQIHRLQLNLTKRPKADGLGLAPPGLAAWIAAFQQRQEEHTMTGIAYPPVEMALEHVKSFNAHHPEGLATGAEPALPDAVSELQAAREQGKREGLEEALARLIRSGMSEGEARQLLGL